MNKTFRSIFGNFAAFALVFALLTVLAFASFGATPIESARAHTAAGSFGCTVSGATVATPSVITCSAAHKLVDGDQIQIINVGGTTTVNTTGYAKVTGYSATTFGFYSDAALSTGVTGTGSYTSGGTVSAAFDVSSITGDWSIRLRLEGLTAGKKVLLALQDSVDGFATSTVLGVINVTGTGTQPFQEYVWRSYQLPSARVGVSNGRLRLTVQSIDSATTATTSWFFEQ